MSTPLSLKTKVKKWWEKSLVVTFLSRIITGGIIAAVFIVFVVTIRLIFNFFKDRSQVITWNKVSQTTVRLWIADTTSAPRQSLAVMHNHRLRVSFRKYFQGLGIATALKFVIDGCISLNRATYIANVQFSWCKLCMLMCDKIIYLFMTYLKE